MWKLDNPLIQALDKLTDLVLISVVWLVLCLTVVGIGPAMTALYYASVKSIRRDRGSAVGEFFRCIRENWKLSAGCGLIFTVLGAALLLFDVPQILPMFRGSWSAAGLLSAVKAVLIGGIAVCLFPLISRYQVRFSGALVTALTLSVRHFPAILAILALVLGAGLAVFSLPLLILILPGGVCVAASYLMEPVLLSILPPQEESPGTDRWYLE